MNCSSYFKSFLIVISIIIATNHNPSATVPINDVPAFNVEDIYEQTFSPDGIANQLVQNFFNWLTSTVFWVCIAPFYNRLLPIFTQDSKGVVGRIFQAVSDSTNEKCRPILDLITAKEAEIASGRFGDVPNISALSSYQITFSPDGAIIQQAQNFFNFVVNTFFWLSFIPFYERMHKIFETGEVEDNELPRSFQDVPNFNVDNIYYQTFSPEGIAIQLIQNFYNWFTSTLFWIFYMSFSSRISPLFSQLLNNPASPRIFGDVPQFNVTNIYATTFNPQGILVQMVDNFFNFVSNTIFWLTYLPFYERLSVIFITDEENSLDIFGDDQLFPQSSQRALKRRKRSTNLKLGNAQVGSVLRGLAKVCDVAQGAFDAYHYTTLDSEDDSARFGDVPAINVTFIYQQVFFPSGIMQQITQNFFNFLVSTFFWLSYIPFYERLYPVFSPSKEPSSGDNLGLNDVPAFNVTNTYEQTYSPDGVAIQLVQNFFNWFTSTVFWLSFLPFNVRLYSMFLPMFTRGLESLRDLGEDGMNNCDGLSLIQTMASSFRWAADFGDRIREYIENPNEGWG